MQYEQRNERFGRLAKQAQFTRPKYLPADLAGLGQDEAFQPRIKWYNTMGAQMFMAVAFGMIIGGVCLAVLF